MFRIDHSTAVASRPAPAAAGTPGYFTGGDPSVPIAPTRVTADWANMVQGEIEAVVLDAGLTPSKTVFTQLRDAVRALIGTAGGAFVPLAQRGAANGVATLDGGGKVPSAQLPAIAITDTFPVASQAAMLALTAEVGDVAIRSDISKTFILRAAPASTLGNWSEMLNPTDAVTSVNGQTGVVALDAGDVGGVATSDWTTVLGSSGSRLCPDGFTEKWGQVSGTYTSEVVISIVFDEPFAIATDNIQLTVMTSVASFVRDMWPQIIGSSVSETGFSIQLQADDGDDNRIDGVHWRVIGR